MGQWLYRGSLDPHNLKNFRNKRENLTPSVWAESKYNPTQSVSEASKAYGNGTLWKQEGAKQLFKESNPWKRFPICWKRFPTHW